MKRVLTAAVLIPIVLYAVFWAPHWMFTVVVCLVAAACFFEYAQMTKTFAPLGFAAGACLLFLPDAQLPLVLTLTALAGLCIPLPEDDLQPAILRTAMLFLGVVYVFGSWKTAVELHALSPNWLIFSLAINWIGDSGAFYVGKNFGRRKLAPVVSPGKTWEGTLGGAACAVIFGCFFIPWAIPGTAWWLGGILALVGNAAGQLGDLAESALKRGAGVKDSGKLLPGHGGMLDRVDSSMFSMPVVLAALKFLH